MNTTPAPTERDRTVRTAVHVCTILDCFADGSQARTLTEIAKEVGLRNSSVYRLLQTLVSTGYIKSEKRTRSYRLGDRLARLRATYDARVSLASVCAPSLERLRSRLRETTSLQIREGNARYNIVEFPSAEHIRMELGQNISYPFPAGASADVLRAFAATWAREPDHQRLRTVRRAGYAVSHGVLVKGGLAVYVPLYNRAKGLIGAIGVYGPAFRMRSESVEQIASVLTSVSSELASRIDPDLPIR